VLVVTTDLPAARSAPFGALRDARGVAFVDAVELGAAGAAERLAVYAAGGHDGPGR
jgi:hypothetical protein